MTGATVDPVAADIGQFVDLQVRTTASDGAISPTLVLDAASEAKLVAIAMTQTSNQEFLRDFENMVMQAVIGGGAPPSTRTN